jgi:hypothetical protein
MSTELSKFAPQNFGELLKFAELAANTDLVPTAFRKKPSDVAIACQMGAELGLQPMQALQNIAVINGKPSLWGDAVIAVVSARPDCEDIKEEFDEKTMTARCTVKRKGRSPVVSTFNQADAENAKLWGKQGPWTQYPKRMLQMRARGFACRDAFPDALRGIITREEAEDYPEPVKIQTQSTDIDSYKIEIQEKLEISGVTEAQIMEKAKVENIQEIYDDEALFSRCLLYLDAVIEKQSEVQP